MNFNGLSEITLRVFRLFFFFIFLLLSMIMGLSIAIMSNTFIILVGIFMGLTLINIVRLSKEIRELHNKE